VVGIPGRVVGALDAQSAERTKIANKMGFDAYGTTADSPDPVAYAINHMLDHIQLMDKQMHDMQQAMNAAGIKCKHEEIPDLHDCELGE